MCLHLRVRNVYTTHLPFSFKVTHIGTQLYRTRGTANWGDHKKYISKEWAREKKERERARMNSLSSLQAQPRIYLETMRARKLHNANQRRSGRKLRGGKKIHQNSWPPLVNSGAFSPKRNDHFFQLHFSASSASRIAAPGIPGIEWHLHAPIPRVYPPRETKFYPSLPSVRTRRCHFSRCTPLFSVAARRSAGRNAFIHVSSLLPHRGSRRAVTETVSALRASLSCISLGPRTSECSCPRLRVKQISFCVNSRVDRQVFCGTFDRWMCHVRCNRHTQNPP